MSRVRVRRDDSSLSHPGRRRTAPRETTPPAIGQVLRDSGYIIRIGERYEPID